MSTIDDDFFDWSGASAPDPVPQADYRRKLHIRHEPATQSYQARGDPFMVLSGLRLLPEDRAYLHGFINALQLPEHIQRDLLQAYRQRWERAAQRSINPNQGDGNGRRSANIWLQQGASGFISWE